jgi:cellulose synthase/poly-beta-1,6-N-acetylglucosamine synthase-like glycosyltransferase
MYLFRIPWGGTLAVKTELLRQTGLLDKWGQAFNEDTMIRNVLQKHGMQVKFVPSLIMLNREECELPSLKYSLMRQLLSSRLYHPLWLAVVSDAISSILIPTLVIVLFLAAVLTGEWNVAALSFGYFGIYTLGLLFMMLALEQGVQQVIRKHGEPMTKLSALTVVKMLIAIPLTQWVYGIAMVLSLGMRRVNWRGISYQIKGPWGIRLVEYRPYELLDEPGDRKVSI